MAESPRKKDLLYIGSDDGRLHTTIDGGKEWTELTMKLPLRRWISRVTPSSHAEGTVYVTQRGREDDDFAAYVYKSTDFGKTFQSIVNNIPAGPVNADVGGKVSLPDKMEVYQSIEGLIHHFELVMPNRGVPTTCARSGGSRSPTRSFCWHWPPS